MAAIDESRRREGERLKAKTVAKWRARQKPDPLVDAAAKLEAADGVCRVKDAFEGGATRSKQGERFDLVPPAAVRALARRLTLGAARHGERNWESGGEDFRQATASHLMAHLLAYMENPNQEDAEALICNSAFLCHFEAKRKPAL